MAWLVVGLLFPVALLNYLDRQMIASMKVSVVRDITGINTDGQWGQMLGQFKWVYAFFCPIGGFVADRFSRRVTICLSLIVWSIITLATGYVRTYDELLWTRTLMGISEAFYIPAALALIADYHLTNTRSRAISVHQMGIYFGVILGGFSGYAADSPNVGWRSAFHLVGLIGVVYAIPLLFFVKDIRFDRKPPKTEESGNQATTVDGNSYLGNLAQLLTNVSFILLVAYFTLPALAGWVVRDWMPSIFKESFAIGQGLAGVSATVYLQVAAIGSAIGGGWLADRWMRKNFRGRIYVSAMGMGLIVPALALVGFATAGGSILLAVMALIVFGIGWGFFDCNNMPILCQIARPSLRATGYGLMNMISIASGGFADKAFGILRDYQVPMPTIFGGLAGICILSIVLVLLIRPQSENVQE
jgi:MFS family permease